MDDGNGDGVGAGAPEGLEAEDGDGIYLEPEYIYPSPSPDKSSATFDKLDAPDPVHHCARPLRRATPLLCVDSEDERDERSH